MEHYLCGEAAQLRRRIADDELRAVLERLMKFVGRNAELLLKNPQEPHCFRVHKDRIYYVSESLMRLATNSKRADLLALSHVRGSWV